MVVVAPQVQQPPIDEEDDIDPLDAFMNELNNATGDEVFIHLFIYLFIYLIFKL